jgi:hypothetical protein
MSDLAIAAIAGLSAFMLSLLVKGEDQKKPMSSNARLGNSSEYYPALIDVNKKKYELHESPKLTLDDTSLQTFMNIDKRSEDTN